MRTFLALSLAFFACNTQPAPEAAPEVTTAEPAAAVEPAVAPAGDWESWGSDFSQERTVVSAAELLADPSKYVDQPVRVEGRVADVCQKMGCWMVVAEGDRSIRVTMKDHGFSVDKQGAGRSCQVDGVIIAKPLDPEEVAHFESESAKPGAMPEKQAQGGVVYELVADGVRMRPAG